MPDDQSEKAKRRAARELRGGEASTPLTTGSPRWWTVRAAQSLKPATYRCPFCQELLPALSEHVLVMPEGDARRRRHAHTACALAERKAGRLPSRDQWLRTQPERPNRLRRLLRRLGRHDQHRSGG